MRSTGTLVLGVLVLLMSMTMVPLAYAATPPPAGVSGVYTGTVAYLGKNWPATFGVIQYQDTIRGVLNVDIAYTDPQGTSYKSAAVLMKGQVSKGIVYFSDYQCSWDNPLCVKFGHAEPDFSAKIRFMDRRIEVTQIQKSDPSNPRPLPLGNAVFKLKDQQLGFKPSYSPGIFGTWEGFGYDYMPHDYVVPIPLPFFYAMKLELAAGTTAGAVTSVTYQKYARSSEWEMRQITLMGADPVHGDVKMGMGYHRYIMRLDQGVLYGLVAFEADHLKYFDFYGLFLLYKK